MKTIFFVEDDAVVVLVYRAKFLREGFGVEVAEDGLVALKMLSTIKPDVIVLDLMIPKLNGVDVLKYIRSNPAFKTTPVIILSNAQMSRLAQEAATIGAERALLKSSCTPGQLIKVINDLLSGNAFDGDPSQRLAVPAPPTRPPPSIQKSSCQIRPPASIIRHGSDATIRIPRRPVLSGR